ncbi:MAG: TIGR00341 family protein [Novosphingobium sp.]
MLNALRQLRPVRAVRMSWLRALARLRMQIDQTGWFPELSGEAGKQLRQTVREEGQLTKAYMLLCMLSAGIAALGLLQSSVAVVIGAMLISPLMGPIASLGFGFASLDGRQIRSSAKVVMVGSLLGIVTGMVITWLSPMRNATPEIVARTAPTLLDLAVAVFSGVAGAYATVRQQGATVIGVAIATALMPPLAALGYSIGVGNLSFAWGAFLLFLTNLAAIAFSFALMARLSGAARPFGQVELALRHIVAGIAAFVVLATPLGVTLYRVTAQASAQRDVRQLLASELHIKQANIAQLEVTWPLRGTPSVYAVVVAPTYTNGAELNLSDKLMEEWGTRPELNLQQVVAADLKSQTEAIVSAAVERSAAGITRDVPPLIAIREGLGLPTQALWVNRTERSVQIVPFAAEGWALGDYRRSEQAALRAAAGWQVQVLPPVASRLFVPVATEDGKPQRSVALDDALWAVGRWGVQGIEVAGVTGGNLGDDDKAKALVLSQFVVDVLGKAGIRAQAVAMTPERVAANSGAGAGIEFRIVRDPVRPPPQP